MTMSISLSLYLCVYISVPMFLLQVMATDLQGNIEKLNNGIAFLIRHAPKLLKVNSLTVSVYFQSIMKSFVLFFSFM